MISKNITKLIDEAIFPALVLVAAKMVGLYLSSLIFHLQFQIKSNALLGVLPGVSFTNITDYVQAENYSNVSMFAVAALGTLLVIIRAHFLHSSHIHPKLHARLVRLNLENLIAPSYHLYHQAVIWLIFLWLSVGFLTLSSVSGVTYPQISIVAFVIAANFSWIFAIDVEKEVELTREAI